MGMGQSKETAKIRWFLPTAFSCPCFNYIYCYADCPFTFRRGDLTAADGRGQQQPAPAPISTKSTVTLTVPLSSGQMTSLLHTEGGQQHPSPAPISTKSTVTLTDPLKFRRGDLTAAHGGGSNSLLLHLFQLNLLLR